VIPTLLHTVFGSFLASSRPQFDWPLHYHSFIGASDAEIFQIKCLIANSILGWSAFAGVTVVLVAYVLNYPLARYSIWVIMSVSFHPTVADHAGVLVGIGIEIVLEGKR
jgi:hypothetical protein